ncbi:MAG TPA: universal stress protein [Propionibacteriaceae bacterium]|nr:universal stress protein [Propionibacteriaceae bacterium]
MSQATPAAGVSGDGGAALATSVIVVGYSSAPEGRAALSRALDEARIRNSKLVVVHASPDEELAALKAELAATGIPHSIRAGDAGIEPAEQLINVAESEGADFIIIGLRRRSPVGKRLLGSNAQRILLDASCPVLAVKAEVSV